MLDKYYINTGKMGSVEGLHGLIYNECSFSVPEIRLMARDPKVYCFYYLQLPAAQDVRAAQDVPAAQDVRAAQDVSAAQDVRAAQNMHAARGEAADRGEL